MFYKYYSICFTVLALGAFCLPDPINLEFSVPEEIWIGGGIGDLTQYVHPDNTNQSSVTQLKILRGDHKGLFQISGYRLLSKQPLNRESICQRNTHPCRTALDIAILSNSQLINILKVRITVLDVNDNAPVFTSNDFTVEVPGEATIGTKFTLPHATDADVGQNKLQGYQLREKLNTPSNFFFLDTSDSSLGYITPKLVLNRIVDRDSSAGLKYDLIAFDGGTPLRSGTVAISVNILESNKHSPQFEKTTYIATCPENAGIGANVLTVKATDSDRGENGRVTYAFRGSHNSSSVDGVLEINELNGIVSLRTSLDYEVKKEYHYTIIAQDHAREPLTTTTEITLFINDINDSPPVITTDSENNLLEINENSPIGSFVALISVDDLDEGDNGRVVCTLQNEKFELKLIIEHEYQLVSAGSLDYETGTNYNVTITCTDKGYPPIESSQKVRILIKDLNDNSPKFDNVIYMASLRENITKSITVTNVKAIDSDSGLNGQINYKLDDRVKRWLAINTTSGQIYTVSPLDHEVMKELIFTVIAHDLGNPSLQSTVTFNLSIIDINDQAADFAEEKYTFGTFENQEIGTEIGSVFATDPDSPPFNSFIYYIINDTFDARSFSIDRQTGTIRTKKILDRESRPSFLFHVGVKNTQRPFMASSVSVTVYVVDKNDNNPVILFPSKSNNTAHLPISAKRGQTFSKIKATDADYGSNSILRYNIINGNEEGLFQLNEYDGSLSLGKDVETFNKSKWTLVIRVKDHGTKVQRFSTISLDIVLDRTFILPATGDRNGTIAKTAGLDHVKIILIFGCVAAALIISLIIIIFIVKRKQRKNCNKKEGIEYEIEDKEELETLHSSCNVYDSLPFVTPNEIEEQRKSRIDSVLLRTRLNGVSESPTSHSSVEEMPLTMDETQSMNGNVTGNETPEIYGIEDLKPMEASTTDMQLYKLIKWLKEVQKNEKRMSENVTEISLPGSSVRGNSLEADATLSPQESESGMFQKQALLRTISPNNTFGRMMSSQSPSDSKYFSLPYNSNSRNKSPDFLSVPQSIANNDIETSSDDESDEQVQTTQPHCGISCKSTPRYLSSCKRAKDNGGIYSVPVDYNMEQEAEKEESDHRQLLASSKTELDKSGSYSPNIISDTGDDCKSKGNAIHSPDDNNCNQSSVEMCSNCNETEEVFSEDKSKSSPKKNNCNKSGLPHDNYVIIDTFKPDKSLKKRSAHEYTDINMNDLNVSQMKTIV